LFRCLLRNICDFYVITYLRRDNRLICKKEEDVNEYVMKSILSLDGRFLSRFAFLNFSYEQQVKIIKTYSSLKILKHLLANILDYESVQTFYRQLREALVSIEPKDLTVCEYYQLALAVNILQREHMVSVSEFNYTYVKAFIAQGFTEEDITSSRELFGMYMYVQSHNPQYLYKTTVDRHMDTDQFYEELEETVYREDNFFYAYREKSFDYSEEQFIALIHNKSISLIYKPLIRIFTKIYFIDVEGQYLKNAKEIITLYVTGRFLEAERIFDTVIPESQNGSYWKDHILSESRESIAALGAEIPDNEYTSYTLKEIITNNHHRGSFHLWPKILNKIRLDLHEHKSIDLMDLNLFLPMYFNRKDSSVANLGTALTVFEKYGFLDTVTSCSIIQYAQNMSEKGIRHIFNDYILQHDPSIIHIIEENFDIDELQIQWLHLPPEYINYFQDSTFFHALNLLLQYHRYSKEIKIEELVNLVESHWWEYTKKLLLEFKYTIQVDEDSSYRDDDTFYDVSLLKIMKKNSSLNSDEKKDHFEKGFLTEEDVSVVRERQMSPSEVASYPDGWFHTLAELSLFELFEKEEVQENIQDILYHASIGTIRSIQMFSSMDYYLGSIPYLVDKYLKGEDSKSLFQAFFYFMEISFLTDWGLLTNDDIL
jgi:hypothetical protein